MPDLIKSHPSIKARFECHPLRHIFPDLSKCFHSLLNVLKTLAVTPSRILALSARHVTFSLPDPQFDFKSLESQDPSNLYISYRLSRASQVALVGRTCLSLRET